MAFDAEWRKRCVVKRCSICDVDQFVKAHYLAKRPAIVLLCLVVECDGSAIGFVTYSSPPISTEVRYGCVVWELSRLYLLDNIPMNAESWLISKSVRWVKRCHKDVGLLVSYADPSVGHSGTIYKAANWQFDGMTDAGRKSPRCDYVDLNTGKKYGRLGNMPRDSVVVRVPRVSKSRFILRIRKNV